VAFDIRPADDPGSAVQYFFSELRAEKTEKAAARKRDRYKICQESLDRQAGREPSEVLHVWRGGTHLATNAEQLEEEGLPDQVDCLVARHILG
jgi:hypothetical protein